MQGLRLTEAALCRELTRTWRAAGATSAASCRAGSPSRRFRPSHTHAQPHLPKTQVIRSDNQKNAVLGVKVFLDLHKSFRNSFEPQFMAFVEFVGQVRLGRGV